MQNFISCSDLLCWNIILKGNSAKSITIDNDGNLTIRPPVTAEEHQQAQREEKARTILLSALSDEHMGDFYHMIDARDIWNAIKARFDGNAESKQMGLPPSWSDIALILKTKGGFEYVSFDDLYNKLKFLEIDTKGYLSSSSTLSNADFGSLKSKCSVVNDVIYFFFANHEIDQHLLYEDLDQMNKEDFEEYDLKHQMAMLSIKVHRFEKKHGRKIKFNGRENARFDKKLVKCFNYKQMGHFSRECQAQGGQNSNNYKKYKSKEVGKDGYDSKAMVVVNGEVVFVDDAIPAGVSVSASDVAAAVVSPHSETEFALMGLSTKAKWNNSGKNLYKLIDISMSVRTKRGLGLDKYIGEGELGIDDSKFSIFHTNIDELEGQPIYNRFTSVDHMKAVPPPLTGNYMPPFNIPDIDESQMVYGKRPLTHLKSRLMMTECSRPNHRDHDSNYSISSVSAPASESRDTIVIDCARQEDFPSVCTSIIETNVKSSKTLCNKFGSFNKESHIRKHKSVTSKSCYVCGSYLHLIKDCDLHEQRLVKRNAEGKVSVGSPNPVSTGQQNTVSTGQPNLVSAGAHYGYNCLPKVPIIPNPGPFNNQTDDELPQSVPSFDPTCYSKEGNSFNYDSKSNLVHDSPNVFDPPSQPSFYSCEFCGNDACYGHYCTPQITSCCDDDDDDNTIGITHKEPDNSLSMGDEHLNTIPAMKLDEFIKSSVENLVPNPSESKGEYVCDVPACEVFTNFSNILFDADYDFYSSDDQSFFHEDTPKKIYSNPLFDEEIISMKIDPHHFNAESDLIESLLNHDSPIISSSLKTNSLFDEFAGELTLLKLILPRISETDCDPEEETRFIKILLYDNSSPRTPKEFIFENSDAAFESFSPSPIPVEDNDSLIEVIDLSFTPDYPKPPGIKEDDYDSERDILILEELLSNDSLSLPKNESFQFDIPSYSRPPAKPPDGNTRILNVKMIGDISKQKVPMARLMSTLFPNQEKSPDLLPHQGYEAFQPSAEYPMMIYGKNTPILDVLFFHFYPLDQFNILGNLKTHAEGFYPSVFISSASSGNHVKDNKEKDKIRAKTEQNQEQTGRVEKSRIKPDKVKAQSKPRKH
nr:ribonuclease H-like domain-containing protein [Tanacetum cinerariifolium]